MLAGALRERAVVVDANPDVSTLALKMPRRADVRSLHALPAIADQVLGDSDLRPFLVHNSLGLDAVISRRRREVDADYEPVKVVEVAPVAQDDSFPSQFVPPYADYATLADAFEEVGTESETRVLDGSQYRGEPSSAESGPPNRSGDRPEELQTNLPVREAAEGESTGVPDSPEASRISVVEPQGFFARLWGAVRGFAGTVRTGERSEDDAERNHRRSG